MCSKLYPNDYSIKRNGIPVAVDGQWIFNGWVRVDQAIKMLKLFFPFCSFTYHPVEEATNPLLPVMQAEGTSGVSAPLFPLKHALEMRDKTNRALLSQ